MNARLIGSISLLLLALAACSGNADPLPGAVLQAPADCLPLGRLCTATGGGGSVGLALPANLKPLTTFEVRVVSSGSPHSVAVLFSMRGMDMGVNRFKLTQAKPGEWRGSAILPVCSMGRSDWLAEVQVTDKSGTTIARFPFSIDG